MGKNSSNDVQILSDLFKLLWPINRSICGPGLRESLEIIKKFLPIDIHECVSGTPVFDWVVPLEWEVVKGLVKDTRGNIVIDFSKNNLHVVSHSNSFVGVVSRETLFEHLHSDPSRPSAIPYRTAFYSEEWGFCLSEEQRVNLTEPFYQVELYTKKLSGSLSFGELIIPGVGKEALVFTTYPCHPSMANNEISGILALVHLGRLLLSFDYSLPYTVRIVFTPETIGDLVYLHENRLDLVENMVGGAVVSMVGNDKQLVMEPAFEPLSKFEECAKACAPFLRSKLEISAVQPMKRMAQRQYASPGFKLPLSALSRAFGGDYDEYHSSLDTIEAINLEKISDVGEDLSYIIRIMSNNCFIKSLKPYGEPFLRKYNLGKALGGEKIDKIDLICRTVLQQADAKTDIISISRMSGFDPDKIIEVVKVLERYELIERV